MQKFIKLSLIKKIVVTFCQVGILATASASTPLWTFDPLTATTVSVPSDGTALINYKITNQSKKKPHTLALQSIPSITQITTGPGNCGNPFFLKSKGSCILSLEVQGSQLTSPIHEGPIVCQQGSHLQCYQPGKPNILSITQGTPTPITPQYSVGGNLFGLVGTLTLGNNGTDPLILNADGSFTFSTELYTGSPYAVSVLTQPAIEFCTVSNGVGTINNANVTTVLVNCSVNTRTVGGTVTGLTGNLTLQNNNTDDLLITGNNPFTFSLPVAEGAGYNVTVFIPPSAQTCTVTNGSGTAGATNITNVLVNCSQNAFTVGGTLSNLVGSVTLQNNMGDNLTLNANGSFTFPTPVAQGSDYSVTVLNQPGTQTCVVTNGSGTVGGGNVTNVLVNCTLNTTTLTTSITDLALSALGRTEFGVPGTPQSGVARQITVTNTGTFTANNLVVTPPTWPTGTTSTTTCGSSLLAGGTCTITVNPGAIATGKPACSAGTAPTPDMVNISSSNASSVSTNVVILDYGCIYQGGYVFAFDDTTPSAQSVGGKTVTAPLTVGQYKWDVNPNPGVATGAWENFIGLNAAVVAGSTNPNTTGTNGPGNTYLISSVLNGNYGNTNGPPANYAAGACIQYTGAGFTDWYLPAICEMTYATAYGCGTVSVPTLQNIQSYLSDTLNLYFGNLYWSSTEDHPVQTQDALVQGYAPGGGNVQSVFKNVPIGVLNVQCARLLTTT